MFPSYLFHSIIWMKYWVSCLIQEESVLHEVFETRHVVPILIHKWSCVVDTQEDYQLLFEFLIKILWVVPYILFLEDMGWEFWFGFNIDMKKITLDSLPLTLPLSYLLFLTWFYIFFLQNYSCITWFFILYLTILMFQRRLVRFQSSSR